ncbi:MAG: asparagine synthase (glutamine-hydrolyzing) [bacterium]
MGGIAGITYWSAEAPGTGEELLSRMVAAMQHRGADCKVQSLKGWGAFGVRSHQPHGYLKEYVYDNSKRLLAVIDGDIFSVRDQSFDPGSLSNADLILQLYSKYGVNFGEKIDGSYAIAVWDESIPQLLLIRDRLGYKPLFYSRLKNAMIFASEIKAILTCEDFEKSVSLRSLNNFLSYGYVPNPDTLFESIYQVKPGHILVCKDGNISEKSYWEIKYRLNGQDTPENHYREKFLETFKNAVSRRLRKYPDAGAFLSGGLDTSAVAAVMYELKGRQPFKVFTAGFKEERYNEINDAKVVADYFGLDHYTILVDFDDNFHSLLEKLVYHHDAPFADTSAIPSYFAAQLAREQGSDVLTGDFPDQLLGGSGHHFKALRSLQHDCLPFRLLKCKSVNRMLTGMTLSAGSNSLLDRTKRMVYRQTHPIEEQRVILDMPIPELLKQCLYSADMLKINAQNNPLSIARSIYEHVSDQDLLNKILYFDMISYAPDDLMVKVERMTMAHGLNAISPFHDLELVEFILTIPTDLKIRGSAGKYLMKEALRPLLPEYTLKKKKQGFAMPIQEWLIRKIPHYVRDILLDSRTLNRGYFSRKFITKMVEDFVSGRTDYASGSEAAIISLITLELWHRIFIDTQPSVNFSGELEILTCGI